MEVLRMVGVLVIPEGACCNVVTREATEMFGVDFPERLPDLDLQIAGANLALSDEMRADLDSQLRNYPVIDFILVTGELPDRDYVAQYLASKFPGKVQVARCVGVSDRDIFQALDDKFYELIEATEEIAVKPRRAGVAVKKTKSPQGAKKRCNEIRTGRRSP